MARTSDRLWLPLILLFALVATPAFAAGPWVRLVPGAGNSLPRIAAPTTGASRRINAMLGRDDAAFRALAAACPAKAPGFDRKVTATMRGPGFLSLVVQDYAYCGTAYPNYGTLALVFDLATGAPVDWSRLLPASLASSVLTENATGSRIGAVESSRLQALYMERYRTAIERMNVVDDVAACVDAVRSDGAFLLWPDAAADGVAAQPIGLPHVAQACEVPVVIPGRVLRGLGVDKGLLDSIDAAQAEGGGPAIR